QIDAEHNYNRQSREVVYRFLAARLHPGVPASEFAERDFQLPPKQDLLAFPAGDLPPGTASLAEVFQSWKVSSWLQAEDASSGELRDSLRDVLQTDIDSPVEISIKGKEIVLSRTGKHDRVTGYWVPGKGGPVLIVDPDGAASALRSDLAKAVMR